MEVVIAVQSGYHRNYEMTDSRHSGHGHRAELEDALGEASPRKKEKQRHVEAMELELELIQTQMTQKPMLRAEVDSANAD